MRSSIQNSVSPRGGVTARHRFCQASRRSDEKAAIGSAGQSETQPVPHLEPSTSFPGSMNSLAGISHHGDYIEQTGCPLRRGGTDGRTAIAMPLVR